MEERMDFELYKSSICHNVKNLGDLSFMLKVLQENEIRVLYSQNRMPECLYLLAMLDYLCRINDVPLCTEYNDLRSFRLSETLFPTDVLLICLWKHNDEAKKQSLQEAIPEFLRHNIVEADIRNVC